MQVRKLGSQGPQDDDESLAALHRAFDSGINWVDTAAVYGLGHAEEVVGQVLREVGQEVLVATKCGRVWHDRPEGEIGNDLRPESIRRELEERLRRLGTGVIAYSPLQSGLLSGSFDAARLDDLPADDWRRRHPNFAEPRLSANLALAERLRPVAERHRVPVAAVAVAWVLAQPGVTAAIVGARRPSQIEGWSEAGTLTLSAADLDELGQAVAETGAGQD